jgi:hypothetical protein
VTPDVTVKPKRCDCNSGNDKKREACKYTILESDGVFQVRRLSVPANRPTSWNLSIFGIPVHPKLEAVEKVPSASWVGIESSPLGEFNVKLIIRTNSMLVRSKLQQALKTVFAIRNKQQKEHNAAVDRLRQAAERPAANLDTLSIRSPSRLSSSVAQNEFDRRPSNSTSVFSMSSTPNMEFAHVQILDSTPLYEME